MMPDFERMEQMTYNEGYRAGYRDGRKSIETKSVKYYDEKENVWKIGEVIVEDEDQTERSRR